jgi:DNA-binding HxlR family transcriptional regulator
VQQAVLGQHAVMARAELVAGGVQGQRPVHVAEEVRAAHPITGGNPAYPEVFALINDKWVIQILQELRAGPRRFTELERAIDGISRRMLTLALRNLERNGLVTRTVYPEVPPRVAYAGTALADGLSGPLEALAAWTRRRRPDIVAARRAYDGRSGTRR